MMTPKHVLRDARHWPVKAVASEASEMEWNKCLIYSPLAHSPLACADRECWLEHEGPKQPADPTP